MLEERFGKGHDSLQGSAFMSKVFKKSMVFAPDSGLLSKLSLSNGGAAKDEDRETVHKVLGKSQENSAAARERHLARHLTSKSRLQDRIKKRQTLIAAMGTSRKAEPLKRKSSKAKVKAERKV